MELFDLWNLPCDDTQAKDSPIIMGAIDDYLTTIKNEYQNMSAKQARDCLLSELNYQNRAQLKSCRCFGLTIKPGDICYIDFGKAYLLEIGYQHFGLVVNVFNAKAFVIPMTSNINTYSQAYDSIENPEGLQHLMRIGKVDGLYKYSVLFLNDGKFINTARIIDIKAHIDSNSTMFAKIISRFVQCLHQN